MKKYFFSFFLVFSLLFLLIGNANAEGVFEVSVPDGIGTSKTLNSGAVGIDFGNLRISGGVESVFISVGTDYEYIDNKDDINNYTSSADLSGRLIVPGGEVKLFLTNNKVKPYIMGGFFKSLASVNVDLSEIEENLEAQEDIDELEDLANDVMNFWGTKLAFGSEYKINEQFGISAETGVRLLFDSVEVEEKITNEYNEVIRKTKSNVSARFGTTYTNISINFYF